MLMHEKNMCDPYIIQQYLSECVVRHRTVLLVNVVQENRLKALRKIINKNVKLLKLGHFFSLRKFRKLQHLLCFFLVYSDQTIA